MSQGLKPGGCGLLNVRAEARTYLRGNGKNKSNCESNDQYRGLSATRLRAPVEMTEFAGEILLPGGGADEA
jgi:hypothetical protein